MRILITGASGSLGSALFRALRYGSDEVLATDIQDLDVREPLQFGEAIRASRPDLIYHLAGAKHAPEGEFDPWHVAETNVVGTRNVLAAGVRTILASTCKAADPETVYGASKLIAERMTLAVGGSVARFYNVPESSGNVFETWRSIPDEEPVPVTDCWRYFVSLERAVDLLVRVADLPAGRYTLKPDRGSWMREEAEALGRRYVMIPPRRGDREIEPLHANSEELRHLGNGVMAIESVHDDARLELVAA